MGLNQSLVLLTNRHAVLFSAVVPIPMTRRQSPKLANNVHDTRALQAYFGHRNIHTYMSPTRSKISGAQRAPFPILWRCCNRDTYLADAPFVAAGAGRLPSCAARRTAHSPSDDGQITSCPAASAAVALAAAELAAAVGLAASHTTRRSCCCGRPDLPAADRLAKAFRIQPSPADRSGERRKVSRLHAILIPSGHSRPYVKLRTQYLICIFFPTSP